MSDEQLAPPRPVALVCGEPRLRRLLRLALEAGGYAVRDCPRPRDLPPPSELAAVVVDLDSLRPRLLASLAHLRAHGLPDTLPALCISVYPVEPDEGARPGPTDYLQPPFPADEVARRVARLLAAAARRGAPDRADGPLSPAR
jgi:DNA-binding response OmpR family regulator